MRFKDFKILTENDQSLQDKVERLRKMPTHKDKDEETLRRMAASWRTREADPKAKPKQTKLKPPVRSYHDDLDDKRYGETNEDSDPCWKDYKQVGMKKKNGKKVPNCVPKESVAEAALGTAPKRPARPGSRPERGHATESRYKKVVEDYCDACDRPKADCICDTEDKLDEHKKGVRAHKYAKKAKGTVDHLDPKKVKEVPGRKVVGPKKIKKLENDLLEAAAIIEGAKVDRMKAHIEKSERKLGHSKDEAESIAWATLNKRGYLDNKNKKKKKVKEDAQICEFCGSHDHTSLDESGKASRSLCLSSKSDTELGSSQLSSCKAQGLRARDGEKSHKVGKQRVRVGGHKIKGKKYGGPLPDWS